MICGGGGKSSLSQYLGWFYETAVFLHELLSETGSLYVHCDPSISHYLKPTLDHIFGMEQFRNEVVWHYGKMSNTSKNFPSNHDCILRYTKSDEYTFNIIKGAESEYRERYKHFLTGNRVLYGSVAHKADKLITGRINKRSRELKRPLIDEDVLFDFDQEYKVQSDVVSVSIIKGNSAERLNYPTQKPEALLERIIRASSNEGDLVLDCFVGSGTTAAVAEKLNRRWIACDLGRFAIHTTRKRLLGIDNVRPFVAQNLGKYERQVWQKAEFGEEAAYQMRSYRKFILDLYHAEMVDGYAWLHGRKGGRMVHVGSVDSPVAVGDVRQIAIEFQQAIGTGKNAPTLAGVDILGWDFALDTNETAQQTAAEAGLKVRFLRIPREVLEKKAVDQGDIKFFELAALQVDKSLKGRELSVWLTDFMIPPDDVPDDVAKAVRHWEDWIDYWAVDFNYRDDTFHNQRQTYRTRKDRTLLPRLNYTYSEPGEYVVLVKVIDILGNDTTKTLNVKVM
ncbi:MAG: DNA methyltransferase [Chloroflexota bacterium]|nr:DNA methyltransferase [Chloroflexota bacterium]MDE2907965.1 DNA methyltransferase [Chloroflexota bacterium]